MPAISLRGTMMSSTVMRSRSRMLTSISWWRSGISAPASATTVRSSSADSECVARACAGAPMSLKIPFANRLISHITGKVTTSSGRYT